MRPLGAFHGVITALCIAKVQHTPIRSVLPWSWLGRAKDAVQSLNSLNEPNFVFCKNQVLQKTRGCTWLLQVAGASWLIISTRCLTLRRAATSSTVCTDRNTLLHARLHCCGGASNSRCESTSEACHGSFHTKYTQQPCMRRHL